MITRDLKGYGERLVEAGATAVKAISPASVATAPWVRWKCQYGCPGFGKSYGCPPHTPTDGETRRVLDSYRRALLCHLRTEPGPDRRRRLKRFREGLLDLEGELFKAGYYKAFCFLAGPCQSCRECACLRQEPCMDPYRARPSLEACGIDVYQTARGNGFTIQPLRTQAEPRNTFCLVLVD
jgi:predicted metal-binding protein